VILSGVSGTGKTWLTELYARAVGAQYRLIPVAPNWNTNEDLLGYHNPLESGNPYHDTDFSLFLRAAAEEFRSARSNRQKARPYHIVLDEMNLARVEYYFATFLATMEIRSRDHQWTEGEEAPLGIGNLTLPPNVYFVGTVNVDETTHGFADKVYDRAQLVELPLCESDLREYFADVAYGDAVIEVWQLVHDVAPFAFRVASDIRSYVDASTTIGRDVDQSLDEQVLQKVLPKLTRTDTRIGAVLRAMVPLCEERHLPKSAAKAKQMLAGFEAYGFASYF
jgi:AAA domain (dynein-related subfamily)